MNCLCMRLDLESYLMMQEIAPVERCVVMRVIQSLVLEAGDLVVVPSPLLKASTVAGLDSGAQP